MPVWICKTCGAHFAPSDAPPSRCAICEDERQYVPEGGQEWFEREALATTHRNEWNELEPNLIGIGVSPAIGIGQRALLVLSPDGNVLWDCTAILDRKTRDRILELGGLKAICLSHPHFYTGMVEWSEALGGVPILLHEVDLAHVTRPSESIHPWQGDRHEVLPGIVLHRLGGHFEGSSVLEWQAGADEKGALLVGDTIQVVADREWVSFMYSSPTRSLCRHARFAALQTALRKYTSIVSMVLGVTSSYLAMQSTASLVLLSATSDCSNRRAVTRGKALRGMTGYNLERFAVGRNFEGAFCPRTALPQTGVRDLARRS